MKSFFFFSVLLQCGLRRTCPEPRHARRADSPLLKSALGLLQPGLQVPHRDLLLLQRGQILLGIWGFDTMVFTAGRVPSRPPETIRGMKCYFSYTKRSSGTAPEGTAVVCWGLKPQ